jgi:endogenous inhibitor of DNA gyrase (YacG/DUF329 family)
MGQSNNREPRRLWKSTETTRARVPCTSCGATARSHAANLPFCDACLDWANQSRATQSNVLEGDEVGAATEALRVHQR